MFQFLAPPNSSHAARLARILALLLLFVCASVAHADLVGHHAGANQLLLSGDGTTAFTGDGKQTRVWNVAAARELGALTEAKVLAVSSDGKRALIRNEVRDIRKPGVHFRYGFVRRQGQYWLGGTLVAERSARLPLLDAIFIGDEAVLMWLGRLERFAPDGTKRTSRPFDEGERLALGSPKTSPPVGKLSPDGKKLILWDRGWARVCDVQTGKRESPIYEPKELRGNGRIYWFSPDNEFVMEKLNFVGDGGYFAQEGPPILTSLAIYNAENGKPFRVQEDVGAFNFPFWPLAKGSLLFQVRTAPNAWKLERRDARTNTVLPLDLRKPGLPERWLTNLIFARDGQTMVALDEDGDIWAEQVKPN